MLDPISIAVGGLLVAGGWLLAQLQRRRPLTSPLTAVCTCSHGYGTHDNGGPCTAEIERPHYWQTGERTAHRPPPVSDA
jgi:hypothetical protein